MLHPLFDTRGRVYVPMTLAGGLLFTGDDGRVWSKQTKHAGFSAVQADPHGVVIARNSFPEGTTAGPVFDGDRMYLRTRQSMLCIGCTGRAGQAYEAEVNADAVLDYVFPGETGPTAAAEVRPVEAPPGVTPSPVPWADPPEKACRRGKGQPWPSLAPALLVAGPMPDAPAEELLASLGGPAGTHPVAGTELRYKGKSYSFSDLDRRAHYRWPALNYRIDLAGLVAAPGAACLCAWLANDAARTMRFELASAGARAYLAGTEIATGRRVKLLPGAYPLLVVVRVPAGTDAPPTFSARFWSSEDPHAERAARLDLLRRNREILERVVRLAPRSPAAARAREALSSIPAAEKKRR